MSEDKEKAEKLLVEYEYYKGQAEALQEGIALLDASIMQIDATIITLGETGSLEKKNEILLPVGSDSFLRATITDTKNAVVGIGAGVAVKKTIKEAAQELEERKKELEKIKVERAEALEKTVAILQEAAPRLQEAISKAEKEG